MVLIGVNVAFVPRYGYMACAWAGFAGYATAMTLSYIVGQKKYPIAYPVKDILVYVALTVAIYCCMAVANSRLPIVAALAVNTVLVVLFTAYIVKKDFPLSSLPVIGRHFRK